MDELFFVLRTTKLDDDTTIKVPDYYYNDVLLRPQELDKMCCYEVKMHYEKVKIPKKRNKSTTGEDYDDVNKTLPPVEDGESSSQTPPN